MISTFTPGMVPASAYCPRMRILVTGGTGYIGSHTAVQLIEAGHDVEIVDSLTNSKASVVDRIGEITGMTPALHVFDLRQADRTDELIAGGEFDAVMHFAGLKAVGESVEKPLEYWDANVGGSTTLLRSLQRHDVRNFVFSSSCTVYGDPETVPVTEATPLQPATNAYGATKATIERILTDVHVADPTWNIALLRYFNPVGAHQSGTIGEDPNDIPNNLMPYICQVAAEKEPELRVFGDDYPTRDGTGIRDYIHVVDLAAGHLAALDFLGEAGGIHAWNLGSGSGTTVLEMVAAFERATGVRVPYRITARRPGDIAATWADPSKANRELGWSTVKTVEDMCEDAWRWQTSGSKL